MKIECDVCGDTLFESVYLRSDVGYITFPCSKCRPEEHKAVQDFWDDRMSV